MPKEQNEFTLKQASRRSFFKQSAVLVAAAATPNVVIEAAENRLDEKLAYQMEQLPITLTINGIEQKINVEPRVTLLDLLREQLNLTGTKKGCDHGQCGACTVHVDGQRINSCMTLAVMQNGRKITTIEGLAQGDELHPMQAAFVKHDGFQCGYCTPGIIVATVALLEKNPRPSTEDIRRGLAGNICRCTGYTKIIAAVLDAATRANEASEGGVV